MSIGIVDIMDMLLTRYNMTDFNKLPLKLGIKLINKGFYEKYKRENWEIWLAKYPTMTKDNFISFDDFFNKPRKIEKTRKDEKDILKECNNITNKIKNGYFKEIKV